MILAGDGGQDSPVTQLVAVGVGVVDLVTKQSLGPPAGPAGAARDGWDAVDEGEEQWARKQEENFHCSSIRRPGWQQAMLRPRV